MVLAISLNMVERKLHISAPSTSLIVSMLSPAATPISAMVAELMIA